MLEYILIIAGFVFVIKGADFLVEGSSSLAKRLNVSDLVIGLTVVAFGTSLPELVVNIFASLGGNSGITVGNIIGSNLFNLLLILGISAIIYPIIVTHSTVWKEIPLSLLAALMVGILANDVFFDKGTINTVTRIDGFVLLAFFAIFMYYVFELAKSGKMKAEKTEEYGITKTIFMIIGGLIGLMVGGKMVVEGAVQLAISFGVTETLIGLTIVAAGTSLPELATSAVAAFKKKSDIAVGNIVGSNIFNIFLVLGISATIRPIVFSSGTNLDIFVLIFSTLLFMLFMFIGKTKKIMNRWKGITFITIYLAYLAYIIMRG